MVGSVRTMEIEDQPQQMGDVREDIMYQQKKYAQKRPMGITLLAISMLLGGIFCILAGLSETPAGVLGMTLTGGFAILLNFVHAGISIYIFYGLFKLKRSVWLLYMAFMGLGIANNLIAIISSGSLAPLMPITFMCMFAYYIYIKQSLFVN